MLESPWITSVPLTRHSLAKHRITESSCRTGQRRTPPGSFAMSSPSPRACARRYALVSGCDRQGRERDKAKGDGRAAHTQQISPSPGPAGSPSTPCAAAASPFSRARSPAPWTKISVRACVFWSLKASRGTQVAGLVAVEHRLDLQQAAHSARLARLADSGDIGNHAQGQLPVSVQREGQRPADEADAELARRAVLFEPAHRRRQRCDGPR